MRCRRESAYTAQDLVGRGRAAGLQPVQLFVDEVNVRAWPGGVGDNKVGSNYAPVIPTQAAAFRQHGTQQARRARAPCPQPRCGGGGSGCLGRATPAFAADRQPPAGGCQPACAWGSAAWQALARAWGRGFAGSAEKLTAQCARVME